MNINQLALQLEEIIAAHDEHLDKASQFGMRSASVKNLMPYADAKKIVDSFDDDTEQLRKFSDTLFTAQREAPDEQSRAAVGKLITKAQTNLRKFQSDLDKAKVALEKWAELLTGEKFQALFQEVRTQVIRLDPADPDGLDFEVDEEMNATRGPYAWGKVIIGPIKDSAGRDLSYSVVVGYRAHTGYYWGNVTRGNKTYKGIATKAKGKTGKQFAKALADQLLAIAKSQGDKFFRSRRSVTLDVLSFEDESNIDNLFDHALQKMGNGWEFARSIEFQTRTATRDVELLRMFQGSPGSFRTLTYEFEQFWNKGLALSRLPVGLRINKNKYPYKITGTVRNLLFKFQHGHTADWIDMSAFEGKRFGTKIVDAFRNALAAKGMVEMATRMPGKRALMARAQELSRQTRLEWSTVEAWERANGLQGVRELLQTITLDTFRLHCKIDGTIHAMKTGGGRTASLPEQVNPMNVVSRFKQAGASWFEERVYTTDPARAWREAVAKARRDYGYGHDGEGYTGSLAEKEYEGYTIERREPFPSWAEASKFADKTDNDKWGPAGAVAVAEPKVLQQEKLTVTVKATNQRQAEQRGRLEIKSTGRIRPRVKVIVEDVKVRKAGGSRTYPQWEVTGVRKQVQMGKITGWLFFGWASS